MPAEYDKIRAENVARYGWDTAVLELLGQLYSERTHFIFELIQNAEDAGATDLTFTLFADRLEVRHDGRDFTVADVRAHLRRGPGHQGGRPDPDRRVRHRLQGRLRVHRQPADPQRRRELPDREIRPALFGGSARRTRGRDRLRVPLRPPRSPRGCRRPARSPLPLATSVSRRCCSCATSSGSAVADWRRRTSCWNGRRPRAAAPAGASACPAAKRSAVATRNGSSGNGGLRHSGGRISGSRSPSWCAPRSTPVG